MTSVELLRARIASESDVFAVRTQARQLAARLGLEGQDQIRVAVALSEIGRRMHAATGVVAVIFSLVVEPAGGVYPVRSGGPRFAMEITAPGPLDEESAQAVAGTRSLMDQWDIERSDERTTISMSRRLPAKAADLSTDEVQLIRTDVAKLTAGTPMEELAEHNRQLLATLGEVQAHRDELLRLNAELEETNRGVMALYTELSEELEATNRGVVALYAELEQRAEQVRAASDSKTRFLANVSHELRSPVTSIVGLVRLLVDPSSDSLTPDQRQQLDLIGGSADTLLRLVNELLDLAKAESGRMEPAAEDVDLKTVFDTLRGTLRAFPASDETELVVAEPADMPTVRTDPVMLTQVLRNLLTNGLKFTPSGRVELTARADGPNVELVVQDTGIGIPAVEQERVFEEFHQVRNAVQATVTGTGLGLPYARRLVEILGGTISLASVEGAGSRFVVRLPIGDAGAAPAADHRVSVLVVDDDEAFRTAAAEVLRRGGFAVAEVADGRTALAAIEAQPPDLVFLDLRLGEMDGAAVLHALDNDPTAAHIPVIVLSAYPEDLADHPAAARALVVLDKTRTTLDDLCGVVRLTVPDRRS
jgi:signal transduction histidine kinase